jgi:WD40 repeat protein
LGRSDGKVLLWDVSNPAVLVPLSQVDHNISATRGISIAFSPDGKTLASCGGAFYLWDISDPANPFLIGERIFAQTGSVEKIAFSPDSKVFATGGVDNDTVTLWDISNLTFPLQIGLLLTAQTTDQRNSVRSLAFSPDGKTLVLGGWDGNVILWDVGMVSWQARACTLAGRNFTQSEWAKFFPGEPYRKTCSQWPEEKW